MSSVDLGVVSGALDPARTVRSAFYDNDSTDPYQATEIFGDEVCSVVTETALYRETSFTIFMPSSGPMISRLGGYLSHDDSALDPDVDSISCPWVYVRRHMSVSFSISEIQQSFLDLNCLF